MSGGNCTDEKYKIEILFGESRSEIRERREGNRIIFESRRVDSDLEGRVVAVYPWGLLSIMTLPAHRTDPWWKFW